MTAILYRYTTFELKPSKKQEAALEELLEFQREVYNVAMEARRGAWEWNGLNTSRRAMYAQLTGWDDPRYKRFGSVVTKGSLWRLQRAFDTFFRRVKEYKAAKARGEKNPPKPGYPRFRSKGRWDSVEWESYVSGWRFPNRKHLWLQGIGSIKLQRHKNQRWLRGDPRTIVVRRRCGKWTVVVACKIEQPDPVHPHPDRAVGVDLGIATFAATSDGELFDNPRWQQRQEPRIADKSRKRLKYRRGSVRYERENTQLKKAYDRSARQRRDYQHKLSKCLVDQYATIAVEDLRLAGGMISRPLPRPDGKGNYELNGRAAKAGLNRAIKDASWGQFVSMLTYKAEEAGGQVVKVEPKYTSQTCHECGHVARENRVTQAEFQCVACGHESHADINAARNILRRGQCLQQSSDECEAPSDGRDSSRPSDSQVQDQDGRFIEDDQNLLELMLSMGGGQ